MVHWAAAEGGGVSRTRIKLVLWAGLFGALLALPAQASAAGFCEKHVVADYEQPLREMPQLASPDPKAKLRFASRPVYLEKRREGPLYLLGRQKQVGYALSIPPPPPAARKRPALDLLVTSKLAEVDSTGSTKRILDTRRKRVTGPKSAGWMDLDLPDRVAYLRLEIVFRNKAGKRLGRYGEYLRVVPEVTDVRMTLNGTTFHPGETVEACLENYGTTETDFGACEPSLQVLENGAWARPAFVKLAYCPAIAYILQAGWATRLGRIALPPDAPPGQYRAHRFGRTEMSTEFTVVKG